MADLNKTNIVEAEVIDAENDNVIKFKKPFEFEGQKYTEITLDLDSLTGNHLERAEMQFVNMNPQLATQTPLKEMSKGFQAVVAAMAAKQPIEFIRALPINEYAKVTSRVMVFLLKGE